MQMQTLVKLPLRLAIILATVCRGEAVSDDLVKLSDLQSRERKIIGLLGEPIGTPLYVRYEALENVVNETTAKGRPPRRLRVTAVSSSKIAKGDAVVYEEHFLRTLRSRDLKRMLAAKSGYCLAFEGIQTVGLPSVHGRMVAISSEGFGVRSNLSIIELIDSEEKLEPLTNVKNQRFRN